MKELLTAVSILLTADQLAAAQVYEVVQVSFKAEVALEQQAEAMDTLNSVVSQFDGFVSRQYFYDEDNQRWLDLIHWSDLELAKAASKTVMQNSQATAVFVLMDEKNTQLSYYKRVGHMQP